MTIDQGRVGRDRGRDSVRVWFLALAQTGICLNALSVTLTLRASVSLGSQTDTNLTLARRCVSHQEDLIECQQQSPLRPNDCFAMMLLCSN